MTPSSAADDVVDPPGGGEEADEVDALAKNKEEKEMSTTDSRVEKEHDAQKLASSLSTLGNSESAAVDAAAKALSIAPADIQAVAEECELSKEQSEALLRKNGGDLKAALRSYIRGS